MSIETDIKEAKSIKDLFNIFDKHYRIEETELTVFQKILVKNYMDTFIKSLNVKKRDANK